MVPTPVAGIEADAAGHARRAWVEQRLFAILGGWVASTPEPDVRIALATACRRHEWHARLWHDVVPAIGEPTVDERIAAGDPAWAAVLDAVTAPTTTVERLAGAWRAVLVHLVAADGARLAAASPVADAPLRRVLELVLADDIAEWRAGEVLLRGVIATDDDLAAALAQQGRVEHLLLAARPG